MRSNGKPFTIYEVTECAGVEHFKSITPTNITSLKIGMYPYVMIQFLLN